VNNAARPDLDALLERLAKLLDALEGAGLRPLMVDATGAGRLLGCSARSVRRMRAAGEMPAPCVLGSGDMTLWRVADLEEFVRCGCVMTRYRAVQARR
jgi:hypothetical protein